MKKLIPLTFIALIFLSACNTASESTESGESTSSTEEASEEPAEVEGIDFHEGTWSEALAKAKSENKLVFLDISASWCGPCKQLKRKSFPDEKVGELFNQNFVNVEVDGEVGEGITLAQQYQLEGYPSLYFINGDGAVVSKAVGFLPPEQLIQFGESVVKK